MQVFEWEAQCMLNPPIIKIAKNWRTAGLRDFSTKVLQMIEGKHLNHLVTLTCI